MDQYERTVVLQAAARLARTGSVIRAQQVKNFVDFDEKVFPVTWEMPLPTMYFLITNV
jgi:hypothetical protein